MLKTQISEDIINYCNEKGTRESEALQHLRNESLSLSNSQMLITQLQGAFLKLLVQIARAKNVLEIGTLTGYSALWLASGLPHDGQLITLDILDRHLALAQKHWQMAGFEHKIKPIIAPALESLAYLQNNGHKFDIIFIDANKTEYIEYYEKSLELLVDGGLILIDNVLMYGKVLENPPPKNYIKVLQELNNLIKTDNRVDICMLPIGDGITIARKKEELGK